MASVGRVDTRAAIAVARRAFPRSPVCELPLEAGRDHLEGQKARGIEADVHGCQLDEAVYQQAAADDQHHRECGLHHHERASETGLRRRGGFAKRVSLVRAEPSKHRHQPEEEAGGDRQDQRIAEDGRIDRHLGQAREHRRQAEIGAPQRRAERMEKLHENKPAGAAAPRRQQKQALGEQMRDEASAYGADRPRTPLAMP